MKSFFAIWTFVVLVLAAFCGAGCQSIPSIAAAGNTANDAQGDDFRKILAANAATPANAKVIADAASDGLKQNATTFDSLNRLAALAIKYQNLWEGSWFAGKAHALGWFSLVCFILAALATVAAILWTPLGPGIVIFLRWLWNKLRLDLTKLGKWVTAEIEKEIEKATSSISVTTETTAATTSTTATLTTPSPTTTGTISAAPFVPGTIAAGNYSINNPPLNPGATVAPLAGLTGAAT